MTTIKLVLELDFKEAEDDLKKALKVDQDQLCWIIEKMLHEGWVQGYKSALEGGADVNPHIAWGASINLEKQEEN